ncbi:HipA domain-containing protein [Arthrobacter sp. AQ5-05]|uniref:HipA domain-containing protein n=1 Tax=Arthrobacter sp. AQ5-05 TaxID=2184581 RepID=UPI0012B63FDE|nr:HipA domain-containing protein [Arthrobacter sp. AQ5-05]
MSFQNAFAMPEFESPDYATLAKPVTIISASPDQDAAELFSRAAMLAMVNNIEDHMRNHGLLQDNAEWRLSPSFDANPSRTGKSNTAPTPRDDSGSRDIRLLVEAADDSDGIEYMHNAFEGKAVPVPLRCPNGNHHHRHRRHSQRHRRRRR